MLWNGNGAITVGSNFKSIKPVGVARCWSKDAKDYVNVSRPSYSHHIASTWVGQIKWIRLFWLSDQRFETESGLDFY